MTGRLYYIAQFDRFFVIGEGEDAGDTYALHCGNHLEIFDNGRWKKTAIEGCDERGINAWYLVDTRYYGKRMQGLRAYVK